MTTLLTAAFLLAAGLLACLAIVLHNFGLIGCAYMLSGRIKAIGDGVYAYRISYAEYRRQALELAPRPVIDMRPEEADRRPVVWRVPTRERVEESA